MRINLLPFVFSFFVIISLENCSILKKSNPNFLSDDSIPRPKPFRPEATFYKGNFFQYFPAPQKNQEKKN